MSNIARSMRLEADRERIRLWQLERKKIAEIERQKRIAEKEKQRADEAKTQTSKVEETVPETVAVPDTEADVKTQSRTQNFALAAQFTGIVILPMALLSLYLFWIATPLYEATTVLSFDQSNTEQSQTAAVFSNTRPPPNLQQTFEANAYISSGALVESLEGLSDDMSDFTNGSSDPIQRLLQAAWLLPETGSELQRLINSSVDIQTGFLTITTRSPTPEKATDLARMVVDDITTRQAQQLDDFTNDQLSNAQNTLEVAEQSLRDARAAFVSLQTSNGIVDPSQEIERINNRISTLENEIAALDLDMGRNQISGRVIPERNAQLVELRDKLTQDVMLLRASMADGNPSLMDLSADFQTAALEIELAERRLDAAYQAMGVAQQTATVEERVIEVVPTTTPKVATYPRKLSTLLSAFVILVAIFFFARLTILRPRPSLF